ncbi:nuclease-related domain-containing protein [Neobacillus sp. SM06]|uniref:nuclease-related domain-containing protein n=1 Tax=Neobacillus sp. SM06 TaxID=3422492 RepID=UPI003D2724C4
MFLNEVTVPKRALIDAALLRRIDPQHPARREIEDDYHARMAGYRGEKSLVYYLKKLPQTKFDIIHGLRLPGENGFFQIDTLILSTMFAFVLEVKNMSGILHFEKLLDQFIRINPQTNSRERYQNPILQAEEQSLQLESWMNRNQLGGLPIEYGFVNSNPKTIITADPGNEWILEKASNSETVNRKIFALSKQYRNEPIGKSAVTKIGQQLLQSHTPPDYSIKEMYHISPHEIRPGVHCPNCFAIPMTYHRGTWECFNCHFTSKTAYIDTIQDHFLLIKPTISNTELRHWLQISSPNITRQFIVSMNLPSGGKNKMKIYFQQ